MRPCSSLFSTICIGHPRSLRLIAYVARRKDAAQLMIVGMFRPTEAADRRRPLRAVLQELHAHRCCEERPLALLTQDDVRAYAARIASDDDAGPLADLLFRSTEGNPRIHDEPS